MSYVMVPVPEEHVPEVMRYVLELSGADEPADDWDEESMRGFFAASDELSRAVLSYMAQPDHSGSVRRDQVARSLELQGYLPKVIKSLKSRATDEFGRVPPIRAEKGTAAGPGRGGGSLLVMDEDVAELVRAAERDVHRAEVGDEGA